MVVCIGYPHDCIVLAAQLVTTAYAMHPMTAPPHSPAEEAAALADLQAEEHACAGLPCCCAVALLVMKT